MGAVASGKALLDGDVEGASDPFGHIAGLTGQAGAEASLEGARIQAQSAREALDYTKEKDALARSDLMPFTNFGKGAMPFYAALLNPQAQAGYLQNNPLFQAAINKSNTGFKNTLGFGGKRGDLQNAITQNYMATGQQYINDAQNDLWNPILMAQNSAAGQATQAQNSAQQGSNLITGAGNAMAAGGIGAANAYSQGAGNIASIGGSLLGALFACDPRLKYDAEPLYRDKDGLTVYSFRYHGHDGLWAGKMADEILKVDPSHVFDNDGVLLVTGKYAPVRLH